MCFLIGSRGIVNSKVTPSGVGTNRISPSWAASRALTIGNPSPVFPASRFVVKKGSKIRSAFALEIGSPSFLILIVCFHLLLDFLNHF